MNGSESADSVSIPLTALFAVPGFPPLFRRSSMPSLNEAQIKNRIAEFVQELDLLVRKSTLEALKGILANGGTTTVRRGPGRPAGAPKGRGRRPADLGDATTKIVDYVKANDGQGISAIASGTGIALPVAKKAALRLLAEGGLKKSGQKRGTVYHVGSGRAPRAKAAKRGRRKA